MDISKEHDGDNSSTHFEVKATAIDSPDFNRTMDGPIKFNDLVGSLSPSNVDDESNDVLTHETSMQ